ncbi:hypothetical protein KY312_00865 [Candidatus Woesearchaeota archaeon]|nr:hypothetical protein [Candidatus Woesearchaeota archaeon]
MLEKILSLFCDTISIPALEEAMQDLNKTRKEYYRTKDTIEAEDLFISYGFDLVEHSKLLLADVGYAVRLKEGIAKLKTPDMYRKKRIIKEAKRDIKEICEAKVKTENMLNEYLKEFSRLDIKRDPGFKRWLGRRYYDIRDNDGNIYTINYKNITDVEFVGSALSKYARLFSNYSSNLEKTDIMSLMKSLISSKK